AGRAVLVQQWGVRTGSAAEVEVVAFRCGAWPGREGSERTCCVPRSLTGQPTEQLEEQYGRPFLSHRRLARCESGVVRGMGWTIGTAQAHASRRLEQRLV